jgi:hypothetical protein
LKKDKKKKGSADRYLAITHLLYRALWSLIVYSCVYNFVYVSQRCCTVSVVSALLLLLWFITWNARVGEEDYNVSTWDSSCAQHAIRSMISPPTKTYCIKDDGRNRSISIGRDTYSLPFWWPSGYLVETCTICRREFSSIVESVFSFVRHNGGKNERFHLQTTWKSHETPNRMMMRVLRVQFLGLSFPVGCRSFYYNCIPENSVCL